jgi:hypothetical protein
MDRDTEIHCKQPGTCVPAVLKKINHRPKFKGTQKGAEVCSFLCALSVKGGNEGDPLRARG